LNVGHCSEVVIRSYERKPHLAGQRRQHHVDLGKNTTAPAQIVVDRPEQLGVTA
jgi:hypothetical protein